jgi:hypothetical protein
MNMKLRTILALLIVGALPVFSLYWAHSVGRNISEVEKAVKLALSFIKNGPTFSFYGILGTLSAVKTEVLESHPPQYSVTIRFDSSHSGYGNRTGQILLQVITHHTAVVRVIDSRVVSAIIGPWDELHQRYLPD